MPLIPDPESLLKSLAPNQRSRRLAGIVRGNSPWAEKLRAIWPRLAVISCWTDAAAALEAIALQNVDLVTAMQEAAIVKQLFAQQPD
jgi:hypothetical protein